MTSTKRRKAKLTKQSMDHNYLALVELQNKKCVDIDDIKTLKDSGYDFKYIVPLNSSNTELRGYTVLHVCVEKESCSNRIIQLCCSRNANYLQKNVKGFTPARLAYEIQKNSMNLLSFKAKKFINAILAIHLKRKHPTNPCCDQGISHFHLACLANSWRVVKLFLDNGVAIDEAINQNSNVFPYCSGLHLAIINECKETVELLMEHGADCLRLNAEGKSPLHLIVEKQMKDYEDKKNENMLEKMLKSTVDDPNPVDCIGLSYLHIYCTRKHSFHSEEWQKLLDAGVDVNASVHVDSSVWPGYTPMHFAACCNFETMLLLLQNGANPFLKNVDGKTPLDFCLGRYNLYKISKIFKAHSALQSIEFQNKTKLSDLFAAFGTIYGSVDFFKRVDVCMATIPHDSPLCPDLPILHLFVESGEKNESIIEQCLEKGMPFTDQDVNGMTALHKAFYKKNMKFVKEILKAHTSIPVNYKDKYGLSHFHIACASNCNKMVKMFLSKNVDPNTMLQSDINLESGDIIKAGSTPLHIAAIIEAPTLAEILLANGADPYRLDADGLTWIHRLFKSSNSRFRQLLLLDGVLRRNPVTPGGLSYLHVACAIGSSRAVKALLPLTANIDRPIGNELKRHFGKFKYSAHSTCLDTSLHLAVKARADETVELLLKNGADIMAKNANGLNPLQVVLLECDSRDYCYYYYCLIRDSMHKEVITRLSLECEKKKMFPDDTGLTKLHISCFLQDLSMIQESLESLEVGQSANNRIQMGSPLWPGEAPLNILIKKGYPKEDDAVKLLLRHIVKEIENAVSDDQPLHESAKRKKKSLLENVNLVNNEGLTAVHISCMGNDVDIVESFLRLGVDFNVSKDFSARKDAGFFPLHFAIKYGSDEVTELLLKYKVNFDCQNKQGNTPINLAISSYKSKLQVYARTKDLFNKPVLDLLFNTYQDDWEKTVSAKLELIATLAQKFSGQAFESLLENIPNVNDVDVKGRNIFHHVKFPQDYEYISSPSQQTISNYFIQIISNSFLKNIELLISHGCELDHQDKEGRTTLHYETLVPGEDVSRIACLLLAGADVNIKDNYGKTPTACCSSWKRGFLRIYLSRLEAAGLHVNDANKQYVRSKDIYPQDLNRMKRYSITKSLTLRDVLTEKIIVEFPMMTKLQQQAIFDYLDSCEVKKNFEDWQLIFYLQRRKALNAKKLHEQTVPLMRNLLDSRLPDHCLNSILIRLSIKDWKNIHLAADQK